MADSEKVRRLAALSMVPQLAEEVVNQIEGASGGSVSADDVTIGEITADNFTFAGGTLTEFAQAIADAIPAA